MSIKIDFKALPRDGVRFEALVFQLLEAMGLRILEQPAVGADGGRDILVERVLSDALGERRERVVVQCKHSAHGGRAVGPAAVAGWQDSLLLYDAQGYLLVTSTTVTETLNRLFLSFTKKSGSVATFWNSDKLVELLSLHVNVRDRFFTPAMPILETKLSEKGWAAIYPAGDSDSTRAIREALRPLLKLRQTQVEQGQGAGVFREFIGDDGYRRGETAHGFLARHGVGPGTPNPSRVPFFVMLIGEPTQIPFSFQLTLGIQYAVARLAFDSCSDYATYANSVVESEAGCVSRLHDVALIAIEHEDDPSSALAAQFVPRLQADLFCEPGDWHVRVVDKGAATKECLQKHLGGSETACITFLVSHGARYMFGHPRRRSFEGAIITADWPGFKWHGPLRSEHLFGSDDVVATGGLQGVIFFLFACSSAGAWAVESSFFPPMEKPQPQGEDFVASLPKKLLGSAQGGALAVIGHIGTTWQMSLEWADAGVQPQTISMLLRSLMAGQPVGMAMHSLTRRYAELATVMIDLVAGGPSVNSVECSQMWAATMDARDYILLGDPAVKIGS